MRSRYLENNSKAINDLMDSTPAEDSLITNLYVPSKFKTIGSEFEETATQTIGTTYSIDLESFEEVQKNQIELQTENPLSTEQKVTISKNEETTESFEDFITEEILTMFMPGLHVEAKKEENPNKINGVEHSKNESKQDAYEGHAKHSEYQNLRSQSSKTTKAIDEKDIKNTTYKAKVSPGPMDHSNFTRLISEINDQRKSDELIYRVPILKQQNAEYEEKTTEPPKSTTFQSRIEHIAKSINKRPFVSRRKQEKENLKEGNNLHITDILEKLSSSTSQNEIERIRNPDYRLYGPINSNYAENNENTLETTTIQSEIQRFRKPIYKHPFASRKSSEIKSVQKETIDSENIEPIGKVSSSTIMYARPYTSKKDTEADTLVKQVEDSEFTDQLEAVLNPSNETTETQENTTNQTETEYEHTEISTKQITNTENPETSTIQSEIQESLSRPPERSTKVSNSDDEVLSYEIKSEEYQENYSVIYQNDETQISKNDDLKTVDQIQEVSKNQKNNTAGPISQTEKETKIVGKIHDSRSTEKYEKVSSSTIRSETHRIRKLIYRPYGFKESPETENIEKDRNVSDSISHLEEFSNQRNINNSEKSETTLIKSEIQRIRKPLFGRPSVSKKNTETENSENESKETKNSDELKMFSSSTIPSIRKPYYRRIQTTRKSPENGHITIKDIDSKEPPNRYDNQKALNSRHQYFNLNRKKILESKNSSSDIDPVIEDPNVETEAQAIINNPSIGRTYTKHPKLKNDVEDDDNAKEAITRAPYALLTRLSTTTETTVRATSKIFNNAIEANKLQQRKNLFLKRTSINEQNLEESEEYYDYDEYVEDEYEDEELVEERDSNDSSRIREGVGSKSFIVYNATNNLTRVNETQVDKYEKVKNVIKDEDNVNSKRRLQKYQLSPFRSHEESVSDKNQVNKNVNDDAAPAEDDEHSTTIENNTTAIPRRKIVLKYRRPLVQPNTNNINNLNNFNSSAVSDTNYNNTATNDSIENKTQINNISTTKRPRKIIRKLIKPLSQISNRTLATHDKNLKDEPYEENVLETSTSVTPTTTLLRKKLLARRPFTTASTTKSSTLKYTRRKYIEYTTAAPLLDNVEDDEEYEDYEDEEADQILLKSTTALLKPRPFYNLQKKNILKTSSTTEASVEAEVADFEEEQPNEKENNVQTPSTTFRTTLNKFVRPAFVPKNRETTNTNRFDSNRKFERPNNIYKPQGVTNRSVPFKPTSARSIERKFSSSTIETPVELEDLDIEALNARNKKIFDSKKYTSFKNKLQTQPFNNSTLEQEQQQQNTENINEIENTTLISIIHNSTTTTISNEIPIVNKTNDNEFSPQAHDVVNTTPQTPSTTLIHIFTLFDEMSTTAKPATNFKPRLLSEQPKHKVVEINRIVEITAKEDKLRRKSKKHPDVLEPIGTSSLKVVSLPHLEQLGEISVVKFVHLVDGSDIEIDGHSTVADYTPTEPNIARNSAPVRNSLPYPYPNYVSAYATERSQVYDVLTQRNGKALIPEVIRESVETSTIPLEGLFDHMRQAKHLNAYNDKFDVTEQPESFTHVGTTSTSTTTAKTTTTIKPTTQYPKYVRPIVPLLRPESNESAPIVISLSNLDQVILSKVGKPLIVKTDKNT